MTAPLPTHTAAWCDVLFVGAGPKALAAVAELLIKTFDSEPGVAGARR